VRKFCESNFFLWVVMHVQAPEKMCYNKTTLLMMGMTSMKKAIDFIKSQDMPPANGYSHVVKVQTCETVYLSGQVPMDAAGNIVGENSMEEQAIQVFENIKQGLEAAGLTFDSVVKLVFYLTDISKMAEVRSVRDQYINTLEPPVSSAVEVSKLIHDNFMIEVEATAVVTEV